MNPSTRLVVSIVTLNSAKWIEHCLESVLAQSVPATIRLFDNGSTDSTLDLAGRFAVAVRCSRENLGFSRAHNLNLVSRDFDYALVLNPDVILDTRFTERLVTSLAATPGAGMAGGKLWRMDDRAAAVKQGGRRVFDTTGIYFTPAQRHFDRGSNQQDCGQYDRRQLVFGISGAALLVSRDLVGDLSIENEFFDEDFFAYREDADLAWRSQLRGWTAVYDPSATGFHRRAVLPANRAAVQAPINFHSVKNRYLMRIKNMDSAVRRRCFPYMWVRDVAIFGYILARERSSWPAYRAVQELKPKFVEKRGIVQSRRKVAPAEIARWFSFKPVAYEL